MPKINGSITDRACIFSISRGYNLQSDGKKRQCRGGFYTRQDCSIGCGLGGYKTRPYENSAADC